MLVITGASGLLGANLVLHARDRGLAIAAVCHRHLVNIPLVKAVCVDLTDSEKTREALNALRPAAVIHCAAATNLDWCEDHPTDAAAINTRASAVLAGIAKDVDARFIYISTDAVFDGSKGNYSEDDAPTPLNIYGRTKLRGEQEVIRANPSALVARVNIYGWNAQNKLSLAEWVLDGLRAGRTVPGFTDVYFTPILVNDLAEILLAMLDRNLTGLYHVGGSEKLSKFDFARKVALTFGFDPGQVAPARLADAPLRARRAPDMSMNTGKIVKALGRAMPDADSGLRRFLSLYETGFRRQLKGYLDGGLV